MELFSVYQLRGHRCEQSLYCVWLETGDARQPLTCVWIDPKAKSSVGSSREAVAGGGEEHLGRLVA